MALAQVNLREPVSSLQLRDQASLAAVGTGSDTLLMSPMKECGRRGFCLYPVASLKKGSCSVNLRDWLERTWYDQPLVSAAVVPSE